MSQRIKSGTEPWTYRVDHGGLFRCCLQSLDDKLVERQKAGGPHPPDGEVMSCHYCSGTMVNDNGVWRWNRKGES